MAIKKNVSRALDTGVVGFNFEDQIVGGEGLHTVTVQSERVAAMRQAADAAGLDAFINARTDLFLKVKGEHHTQSMLDEAVTRAKAYADNGASGFFAPGLLNIDMITELCERVDIPVNIIALPGAPDGKALARAGVARISYGPVPYKRMAEWLKNEAQTCIASTH